MPVALPGGCLVSSLREGASIDAESLRVWPIFGAGVGDDRATSAISLRAFDVGTGLTPGLRNASCDEVLYVIEGDGTFVLDGAAHSIGADTGIYVKAGVTYAISNHGERPIVLASSRCPDPGGELETFEALPAPSRDRRPLKLPIVKLVDREPRPSNGGARTYAQLLDGSIGSDTVTQYVATIPSGRAAQHRHEHEEVLCVLRGEGRMWSGDASTPIATGSCMFVPKGAAHVVESTGSVDMLLLGVFHAEATRDASARYDV